MATTHVRPAPARDTATTPERPRTESRTSRLEDQIDYVTVRHARTIASKRGEKPIAWEDFKKKLAR
jgi:hypothetical protein